CHRVALMHDGQIHQVGTPAAIRTGLGLDRLQVRSENLGTAEEVLSSVSEIADVQRFGDRLDVMVRDAEKGAEVAAETLSKAGIAVTEIKPTSPTLENAFVATLRQLGGELSTPAFPRRRQFRQRPKDAIAIGAHHLYKRFGKFNAVKDINIEIKYGE